MQNIWSVCKSEDTRELFILLGVDKKYINGEASDYECFAQFCRACRQLKGNAEAERISVEISARIGRKMGIAQLAECDTRELWRECNDKVLSGEKYNILSTPIPSEIYVKKHNIMSDCVDLNEFLSEAYSKGGRDAKKAWSLLENTADNIFAVSFCGDAFARPNSFAFENEYAKYINDEKYNLNLILCELIFRKIYISKCEKIQLILRLDDNIQYIEELIDHMRLRTLGARIYLCTDEQTPPEAIKRICLRSSENCLITPILTGGACTQKYLSSLARIYPAGMILQM